MAKPFGAEHTQIKLGALFNYLPAYTTALSNRPFTLHYVDAFAGTGKCTIRLGNRSKTIPGSAWLALECEPRFDKLVFIEKAPSKVKELRDLVANPHFAGRDCTIQRGDANELLPAYLDQLGPGDRAVVNLDPFGMDVHWSTLEKIAASKIADVFYLFPLSSSTGSSGRTIGGLLSMRQRGRLTCSRGKPRTNVTRTPIAWRNGSRAA